MNRFIKSHSFAVPSSCYSCDPTFRSKLSHRLLIGGVAIIMWVAVLPLHVSAQDQGFPAPVMTGLLGYKDSGALAEITAHLQVVSVAGWQDAEATGTLTYSDGDEHPAALYLSGSANSRLDVTMDNGTRSLRQAGAVGASQDESGNQSQILPSTSQVGIVAFPRIWTDATTCKTVSLYDQGIFMSAGTTLHRITIEYQIKSGIYSPGDPTAATDLYFDPNTHLLLYSVDTVEFVSAVGQRFVRTTSYASYVNSSGILFPTLIQQMLDGQTLWSLQLTQVSVNTNPPQNTFSF